MNWRVERKIVEEEEVIDDKIDNDNDTDNDTTHNLNDVTKKKRNQSGQRQRRILIIKDRIHADIGKKNQTKKAYVVAS